MKKKIFQSIRHLSDMVEKSNIHVLESGNRMSERAIQRDCGQEFPKLMKGLKPVSTWGTVLLTGHEGNAN